MKKFLKFLIYSHIGLVFIYFAKFLRIFFVRVDEMSDIERKWFLIGVELEFIIASFLMFAFMISYFYFQKNPEKSTLSDIFYFFLRSVIFFALFFGVYIKILPLLPHDFFGIFDGLIIYCYFIFCIFVTFFWDFQKFFKK